MLCTFGYHTMNGMDAVFLFMQFLNEKVLRNLLIPESIIHGHIQRNIHIHSVVFLLHNRHPFHE